MISLNLINLYKQLKLPTDKNNEDQMRFSAIPIPGYINHRLAKDSNGYPCLLISTQETNSTRPAPIKLEHLRVLFDVDCRISHKNQSENNRFTVVCCTEQDSMMQEYFLRISSAIIPVVGGNPTHSQVSKAVNNLAELFRVMNEAPRKSVQGLWAELLLISLARDPLSLVRAWHRDPDDKFDFSSGDQRVEVKSSISKVRQHHFALEQLKPSSGVDVLITSVYVERVGSGVSLAELAETVRARINKEPELLLYLDQVIGKTLGNEWRSAAKDKFDIKLAKKSLLYFITKNIPCIDPNLPKGVSNVHFKVDLSDTTPLEEVALKTQKGLFNAAMPK